MPADAYRNARWPFVLPFLLRPTTTEPSAETPWASEAFLPGRVPRSVMPAEVHRNAWQPFVLVL